MDRDDVVAVEKEEEIAAVVTNYFKNLFSSHAQQRLEELLDQVVPHVTQDMNEQLSKPYTAEEVKYACLVLAI